MLLALDTLEQLRTDPGARAQDMTSEQVRSVRAFLDSSLFAFAYFVFGYTDLTPGFHGPVCQFLEQWGKGPGEAPGGSALTGWKRLALTIPRESFKTSLATRANSLWQIARDPHHNPTIAIFNAKEDNAAKWVRAIREVAEASHLLHICYPEMMPPGVGTCCLRHQDESRPKGWKWSNTEIDFVRTQIGIPEASITALGIGGAATGGHWTHILADDIIGLEESRSPSMMQAARDWIDVARFLERPADKGNVLFVYTRWHYDDCYRYLLEKWADEYVLYHRGALDDEGLATERSAFPEKWSTEDLHRMRERDPYNFAAQMMSQPRAGKETSFDPAWNRYCAVSFLDDGDISFRIPAALYDPKLHELPPEVEGIPELAPQEVLRSQCDAALFWDPAPSEMRDKNKDGRARNGKVAIFRDPWHRDFIPEARGTRMDPLDEMRDTITLAAKWGITKIAVEEVNFSKVYRHIGQYLLEKEFPELRDLIYFIKLKEERTQKDTRILGLIPRWRSGMIYVGPEAAQLLVEAREYPFGRTRDLLDGCAMDSKNKVLSPPLTITFMRQAQIKSRTQYLIGGRDAVTGYTFWPVALLMTLMSSGLLDVPNTLPTCASGTSGIQATMCATSSGGA